MIINIKVKMVIKMKLSEKIKDERLKKNINQPELAKLMNVTKQTVSNWENGHRIPEANTLKALADLFDCSVDYLLSRTEQRNGFISEYNVDGQKVVLELSKDVYPNGLTIEELLEKLKLIKKLEEMGISFPKEEEEEQK